MRLQAAALTLSYLHNEKAILDSNGYIDVQNLGMLVELTKEIMRSVVSHVFPRLSVFSSNWFCEQWILAQKSMKYVTRDSRLSSEVCSETKWVPRFFSSQTLNESCNIHQEFWVWDVVQQISPSCQIFSVMSFPKMSSYPGYQ